MPYLISHSKNIINPIQYSGGSFWNKLKNWLVRRKIKRVEFWLIELNEGKLKRKIALEFDKRPIPKTKFLDVELNEFHPNDNQEISSELFNDIYRLSSLTDWNELVQTHKKYLSRWNSDQISYPILLTDSDGGVDEFESLESIEYEFEGYSYEVEDEQCIIESNGISRKLEFWNFGHPVGVVVPSTQTQKITNAEISSLTNNKFINWLK